MSELFVLLKYKMVKMNKEKTWVVVSRYQADTAWTQKLAENGHPVFIYEHIPNSTSPYNLPGNKGNEAGAYFKFIVDYYDALPQYIAFIHDHETSWHHKGSLVDKILEHQERKKRPQYENLNHLCLNHAIGNDKYPKLKWFYEKFLEPYIGPSHKPDWTYGHQCCAQFIVHRNRIQKLPKKFYQDIYNWIITTKWDSKVVGHVACEWTVFLYLNNGKKDLGKCERII